MNEDIFKNGKILFAKLEDYGFEKIDDKYVFKKNIMGDRLQVVIEIKTKVEWAIYDLKTNEEYTNYRSLMEGEFVNKVRLELKSILEDIKAKCFVIEHFEGGQTTRIVNIIKDRLKVLPEFLWDDDPRCGVFRKNNKKWFAIIMNVKKSKLKPEEGNVDIINVKLREQEIKQLLLVEGFYPAYHMNKKYWLTIILDDTIEDEKIGELVLESYSLVS